MAGPCACRSFCCNISPAGKNKLAGAAPTDGSGTFTPIPVISYASTFASVIAFAIAPTLDHKLFKQFLKAYLEA